MSTVGGGASVPEETEGDAALEPVEFWSAFKRAHEVVRARVVADTAEAAGFSEPDLAILVSLEKAGGSLRQSELAASLGWDRTRISHQLTRMGERGLVTRVRAGSAAAGVTVVLADVGRDAIAAVRPALESAVRRHFTDKLSAQEIEILGRVLRRF